MSTVGWAPPKPCTVRSAPALRPFRFVARSRSPAAAFPLPVLSSCTKGIISTIGSEILPYIVFLVVPILGRMSDFNERIRKVVTYCFATLIKLMPLEVPLPPRVDAVPIVAIG